MVAVKGKDSILKETALVSIQHILVSKYNVSSDLAATLIKRSKIDQIFDRNAEIASHTSNKTWAQRAYEQLHEDENKNENEGKNEHEYEHVSECAVHEVVKTTRYSRKRKVNVSELQVSSE